MLLQVPEPLLGDVNEGLEEFERRADGREHASLREHLGVLALG